MSRDDGLGPFRGLMIALPVGAAFWAMVWWLL